MILTVGVGNTVRFWHDRWCEPGILKNIFPRLFSISSQKTFCINSLGEWNGNSWVWSLEWRGTLYEWEREQVRSLQDIIVRYGPSRQRRDGVMWKQSGHTNYPTRSIMAKLNENYSPILPKHIVHIVWQKFIPPRAKLAVWLANMEKLKTGDFLVEKGIITSHDALCPFCGLEIESNSHIIFTCRFAWSTWMEILNWWSLSAALQNRFTNFCSQWMGLQKSKKAKEFWGLTLGCVIWSIWYEKNQIKFNQRSPYLPSFVHSLKIRIGIWAREILGFSCSSPQNIIYDVESFVLQV